MSGFDLNMGISGTAVFAQGFLSFFSPCVLPLLPLYMGYLSGGTAQVGEEGEVMFRRKSLFLNTVFFVFGISTAFFLLGFGFTAVGSLLGGLDGVLTLFGGLLILAFGCYQLGCLGSSSLLSKERRLPFSLNRFAMSPWVALVMGFTFSFGWTPCIGPTLTSVLLMASSSPTQAFGLIGLYTLGFVLPFLGLGLFAGSLLALFKGKQHLMGYGVKAGGILMILMGAMMVGPTLQGMLGFSTPLPTSQGVGDSSSQGASHPVTGEDGSSGEYSGVSDVVFAPDFTLTDQYGQEHTLSDYRGKTVFLNFWATWCSPCVEEMPDIQALYGDWGYNQGELIILGVSNPTTEQYRGMDGTIEEISAFMSTNGWNYPTLMDEVGLVRSTYGVTAFPTTVMIAPDGSVYGGIAGGIPREVMDSIVEETMNS